jgi:putative nucleotidyltransferase with HDIG domain
VNDKTHVPYQTPTDPSSIGSAENSNSYISFDPRSLHENEEVTFALYVYNKEKNRYVLYKQKDQVLEPERLASLTQGGVRSVFVHKDDSQQLQAYLAGSLITLVDDPTLQIEEKTEKFHALASTVMKALFDAPPDTKTFIRSASHVSSSIARLMTNEPKAIMYLNQLRSYDYYTYSHSMNVAVLSMGLYQELHPNASINTLEDYTRGVLLHDIGKCAISNDILNKRGPLDEKEWEIMKSHTTQGFERLREDKTLSEDSRSVALLHHEAVDGTGYPCQLKADGIPLSARICKVVDVYDALSSKRSYKNRMIPYRALQIMTQDMKTKIDMSILEKFVIFLHKMGKFNVRR